MAADRTSPAPDESPEERVDRNLIELLNELRVVLPGVQVLFAFLLVVPFNTGFETVTPFQRDVYLATLLCVALATLCLIAPSAHHRIQFRRQDKEFVVVVGTRFAIAGLVLVALSICGTILLVVSYVFDDQLAEIVTIILAALFALVWFVVPLARRLRGLAPAEDEPARRSQPGDD